MDSQKTLSGFQSRKGTPCCHLARLDMRSAPYGLEMWVPQSLKSATFFCDIRSDGLNLTSPRMTERSGFRLCSRTLSSNLSSSLDLGRWLSAAGCHNVSRNPGLKRDSIAPKVDLLADIFSVRLEAGFTHFCCHSMGNSSTKPIICITRTSISPRYWNGIAPSMNE
jgi:hypothetical protein